MAAYRTGWAPPIRGVLTLKGPIPKAPLGMAAILLVGSLVALRVDTVPIRCTREPSGQGSCRAAGRTIALADIAGLNFDTRMSTTRTVAVDRGQRSETVTQPVRRLQIVTSYGMFPLEDGWSSGEPDNRDALAAAFDAFLHGTAPSFPASTSGLRQYALSAAFALGAVLLYLFAARRRTAATLSLDEGGSHLRVTRTEASGVETSVLSFKPKPWVTTAEDDGLWLCLAHAESRIKLIRIPTDAAAQSHVMGRVEAFIGPEDEEPAVPA